MCLLNSPSVVVCLHLSQLGELREELHEPDEEVHSGLLTVLGKDDVNVEVLVDDVDHVGQEVVEGRLEEVSYLGMGWGWEGGQGVPLEGVGVGYWMVKGVCGDGYRVCGVQRIFNWESVTDSYNKYG